MMLLRISATAAVLLLSTSSFVTGFTRTMSIPSTLAASSFSSSPSSSLSALAMSKQAEYGKSLDLPESYVKCGRCQTVYALTEEDLGGGRGRRLSCSVCGHSWFQSRDRIMTVNDSFQLVPLPDTDKERIATNIKEGKNPGWVGEAKLYVGNVAFGCHEDDLIEVFSTAGEVGEVSLVRDNEGKVRGFGFITMRNKEDADKAIAELDGVELRGRRLQVRESNN